MEEVVLNLPVFLPPAPLFLSPLFLVSVGTQGRLGRWTGEPVMEVVGLL